jgi:hypothetical protein
MLTTLTLLAALAPATAPSEVQELDRPTLIGLATLPADTFRPGPTSGQLIDPANDRTPPFVDQQPVQGISSLHKTDWPGTYLALSDNGFGGKANSPDYVLCLYSVTPNWQSGEVAWQLAVELSDPDHHVPWPIVAEGETYPGTDVPVDPRIKDNRLLTGADFDVESLVVLPDGTMWVGDEFGPFLLHFDAEGRLQEAPFDVIYAGISSPDMPMERPNPPLVGRSRGFEAMLLKPILNIDGSPSGEHAVEAILEGPLQQDLERLGEQGRFSRPFWFGPLEGPAEARSMMITRGPHLTDGAEAIGEAALTAYGMRKDGSMFEKTVRVERDGEQAANAKVKRLVFESVDEREPEVAKSGRIELVDLLDLHDPNDLDGDGSDTFRFPFVTIESVVVLDERTLLVCNDNNYPFSNGRSDVEPDATEFILIRLPRPIGEMAAPAE